MLNKLQLDKVNNGITVGTAAFILVLGCVVMLGWFLRITALIQILPSLVPMQFNTALCFALLGAAALFNKRRNLSTTLTVSCLLIATITLLQYIFELNTGLDHLFIEPHVSTKTHHIGRMAPNTALCFTILSIALYISNKSLVDYEAKANDSLTLSLFVFILSIVSLVGYLFSIESAYGWGHFTHMAVHTAIGFFIFSTGLIIRSFYTLKFQKKGTFKPQHLFILLSTIITMMVWQTMVKAEADNILNTLKEHGQQLNDEIGLGYQRTTKSLIRMADRLLQTPEVGELIHRKDAVNFINDQGWPFAIELLNPNGQERWQESSFLEPLNDSVNSQFSQQRWSTIELAKQQRKLTLSAPIKVSETDYRLLIVVPLITEQQEFIGFLIGSFCIADFIDSIINPHQRDLYHYAMHYLGNKVFESESASVIANNRLSAGFSARDTRYVLMASAKNKLFDEYRTPLPESVLGFGLSLSVLLALVLQLWDRTKKHARSLRVNQKQLTKNIALQDAILNDLGEAVVIFDRHGFVIQFTSAAEQLFGYQESEIIGKDVNNLVQHNSENDDITFDENIFNPQLSESDIGKRKIISGLSKVGKNIPLEVIVSQVESTDSLIYVALLTDISKRLQHHNELLQAKNIAEAANQSKGQFLANMSHEIRTPMNGILGTLQLLDKKATKQENKTLIKNAILSANSLLTIINDILDFSKIEANMLTLEKTYFTFRPIVELTISDLSPAANANGIVIKTHIVDNLQNAWIGDPVRVKQILLNLFSNAVKFTHKGSITLTVDDKHPITQKVGLYFSVKDTGIGMTAEGQAKIFNRFEQADNSTTRQFGGTGLGMTITQQLVEKMHGSIELVSREGAGSTFSVFLPLSPTDEQKDSEDENSTGEMSTPDLSAYSILLAEDNNINQTVFEAMMEPTGATVFVAANGQQAIDIYLKRKINLIFMDIQMPVMDGIEACCQIKAMDNNIPIIALTANVMESDIQLYKEKGFDAHLGKPVDMTKLFATATSFLAAP
ncbi:ATP-binding protein [Alteromonadaceae bacterium BrNp21-10]|nr:ATP-binding protein [Alteromonadaceae bacterium BrNp21-10]